MRSTGDIQHNRRLSNWTALQLASVTTGQRYNWPALQLDSVTTGQRYNWTALQLDSVTTAQYNKNDNVTEMDITEMIV